MLTMTTLLYLDQNYLSGIVKRKPGFRELEPVLRAVVARGAVALPESEGHRRESASAGFICHHMPMKRQQTLVQLTDELVALLDERAAKSGRSRSELIRAAIERYLADDREAAIDAAIVAGYERVPEEADPWADLLAREAIAAEPW